MQKIGDHSIKIMVSDEQLEKIDQIAKRHDLKRAQVVRNMMDIGLEVYDDLNLVGMVKALELYEAGKAWVDKKKKSKQLRMA